MYGELYEVQVVLTRELQLRVMQDVARQDGRVV
jgi:hypothetical protein